MAKLPLLWPEDMHELKACVQACGERVTIRRAELSTGRVRVIVIERVGDGVEETEI